MPFARTLLSLLLWALVAGAHGQAYKWVDEQGQVHYGQQPPTGGQAETLPLPKARAPAGDPGEATRARSEASDERRQEADEAQAQAQARAEQEQARRDACATMRTNLEVLQTRSRVRELKDGEYVPLSPEAQQARIEELRTQLEEHCQTP